MSLPASGVGPQGVRIALVRVPLNGRCFCLSPLEQTVSASVEVTVTVTSQNYSEQLQDRQSDEFKEFNKTFTEQVTLGTPARAIRPPPTPHCILWRGEDGSRVC